MHPTRLLLALVSLTAWLGLTACGDDPGVAGRPLTLTVVATDWNGWDPDHVPTPETSTTRVEPGAEVALGGETLTVAEVRGDEVVVETSGQMAPASDGGGMDLDDLEDRFEVGLDEPVEFSTPTLDGGTSYVVTLAVA